MTQFTVEVLTAFSTDINECEEITDTGKTGEETCNLINARCRNTPGSYECTCKPGYQRVGEVCLGKFRLIHVGANSQ